MWFPNEWNKEKSKKTAKRLTRVAAEKQAISCRGRETDRNYAAVAEEEQAPNFLQ